MKKFSSLSDSDTWLRIMQASESQSSQLQKKIREVVIEFRKIFDQIELNFSICNRNSGIAIWEAFSCAELAEKGNLVIEGSRI